MNLSAAGVGLEPHGSIEVNRFLQTSASHVYAAGNVTGRLVLVPGTIEDGFVAATNAVQGPTYPLPHLLSPSGSFTHPEYAQVGLTEAKARETHDVVTTVAPFEGVVRAIIEGRTLGFCKRVVDRASFGFWGATWSASERWRSRSWRRSPSRRRRRLDELARVAVSPPTYAEVLVHAAIRAAVELDLPLSGQAETWA